MTSIQHDLRAEKQNEYGTLTPLEVVQKLRGSKAEKKGKEAIFVTSSYEVHAARFGRHMRAMECFVVLSWRSCLLLLAVTKRTIYIYQK